MVRHSSIMDHCVAVFDTALRSLFVPEVRPSQRINPGDNLPEASLSDREKRHVSGLMRVNHAGEVCAQALYQGQAMTAKCATTREHMAQAAEEEKDHLAWCEARLHELGSATTWLNPFWYANSLMLGLIAGWLGDKWSLGFVAETELQVTEHLEKHLQALPAQDKKSKAIVLQMQSDEQNHAKMAQESGAAELPYPVKQAMRLLSKCMTKTSYYF